MEQKNKKKKGSGAAAAFVLVLALLGNLAETGDVAAVIVLFSAVVIGISAFAIGKAAKKAKAAMPVIKKKQEPCEFGKANHEFSHDAAQRLAQLDGFYKDGLIDRAEYERLKQRWSE